MRVFVAGATGALGKQLVPILAERGHSVVGMTRSEVVSTLQGCGIYLDLGHHPGKDRMPREAALSGALTVVARRGSGAFFADVPVPWEHKITPGRDEGETGLVGSGRFGHELHPVRLGGPAGGRAPPGGRDVHACLVIRAITGLRSAARRISPGCRNARPPRDRR